MTRVLEAPTMDRRPSLSALYDRHRRPLERYCRGLLRDPDDAADAAQETWLRAHVALTEPEPRVASFGPWLFTVARNVCLDRLRDRARSGSTPLDQLELAGGDTPHETLERREELELLLGDLRQLSERQRAAVVLREVSGLSGEDLARALSTTVDGAECLVGEARRALGEQRRGRDLSCSEVRSALSVGQRMRHRSLRAHLASCDGCSREARRLRGQRLSSRCLAPVPLIIAAMQRLRAVAGSGDGALAGAKPAVAAGLAAVAVCAAGGPGVAGRRDAGRTPPVVAAQAAPAAPVAPAPHRRYRSQRSEPARHHAVRRPERSPTSSAAVPTTQSTAPPPQIASQPATVASAPPAPPAAPAKPAATSAERSAPAPVGDVPAVAATLSDAVQTATQSVLPPAASLVDAVTQTASAALPPLAR